MGLPLSVSSLDFPVLEVDVVTQGLSVFANVLAILAREGSGICTMKVFKVQLQISPESIRGATHLATKPHAAALRHTERGEHA